LGDEFVNEIHCDYSVPRSKAIVDLAKRARRQKDGSMKFWTWEEKNLPSITHAIRTAVAATVSVIIARLVQMPEA